MTSQLPQSRLSDRELQRIGRIRDAFRLALEDGANCSIENRLSAVPARLRDALLLDLLRCQLEFDRRDGRVSRVDDYLRQFPDSTAVVRLAFESFEVTLNPDNARPEPPPSDPTRPDTPRPDSSRPDSPRPPATATDEGESDSDPEVTHGYDREALGVGKFIGVDSPPERIDRYEIEEVLGRGGMGVVYRARDPELKRPVALKMIRIGGRTGGIELQRFRAEAEAVARLQHPNIVQVFALGSHEGSPYLALELVEGGNLSQRIGTDPWNPRLSAELCAILARAVHYAHQQGVVHRDLKPGNVLISGASPSEDFTLHDAGSTQAGVTSGNEPATIRMPRSEVGQQSEMSWGSRSSTGTMSNGWIPKVADFGLARTMDGGHDITTTGEILGTPAYMAPEQAEGKIKPGPPCDIYALGCILYWLLTGRPPFQGATAVETIRHVVEVEPVSPQVMRPGLSVDLATICLKCLEKQPGQRYLTARDLADDLTRFLNGETILARPASLLERLSKWARRRPAVAALSGALIAVVAIGFAVVAWQWREALHLAQSNLQLAGRERTARGEAETLAADKNRLAIQEQAARREADLRRGEAEHQLRIANSARLAAQSSAVRAKNPVLSLLLAVESVTSTQKAGDALLTESYEALISSVASVGGIPLTGHTEPVEEAVFSPDGKWLATTSWDHSIRLWDLDQPDPGDASRVLTGHTNRVMCAAFSPNSEWLITGSEDSRVRIWSLASFQSVVVMPQPGEVLALDVSPDGHWLAAGGGASVSLYDLEARDIEISRRDLTGPARTVRQIRFTPDSSTVIAVGDDDGAFVWTLGEPDAGFELVKMPGLPAGGRCLDVDRSGSRFAVAAGGSAVVWRLDDRQSAPLHLTENGGAVTAVRFSPDGRKLLTSCGDATARIWNLEADNVAGSFLTLRGHDHYTSWVDVSPEGRWAATVAADAQVRLWDLHSARPDQASRILPGHRGFLAKARFSPNGRWLLTAGWDRITRLWDMQKPLPTASPLILQAADTVTAADLSADDRWLAVGYGEGGLLIWDLKSPDRAPGQFHQHMGKVRKVEISRDGRWVLTAGEDRAAWLLDRDSGEAPQLFASQLGWVTGIAVSGNGHWAAAGREDGFVLLRDLNGRLPDRPLSLGETVTDLTFSSDDRWLAIGGRSGLVGVFDLESESLEIARSPKTHDGAAHDLSFVQGSRLASFGGSMAMLWGFESPDEPRVFTGHTGTGPVAVSRKRRWLATGSWDTLVRLWDCDSPESEPVILEGHSGAIDGCAISPDERWLVTSSRDETVLMWDLHGGGQSSSPIVLHGHTGTISVARFTHAGDRLITGGNGFSIRVWDLKVESLLKAAEQAAGRTLSRQERRQYLGTR